MKKLAVGAENWSIDTFSPSVDLGITSSRLFLPRPQIGHTRIAEGFADTQADGRNRHSSLFPASSRPILTCLSFYPAPDFFVCLFFCSQGEGGEGGEGRVVIEREGCV